MADPVSLVGASNAGVNLIKSAAGGLTAARRRFRLLGTYAPELFPLNFEPAKTTQEDVVTLTAADVEDIERFLGSPDMAPILAMYAAAKLSVSDDSRVLALQQHNRLFHNEALRWIARNDSKWKGAIPSIIDRVDRIYGGTLDGFSSSVDSDELSEFLDFVQAPSLSGGAQAITHLSRLVYMSSDLEALSECLTISRRIAQAVGSVDYQPILTHTELDEPSRFLDLYVSRNFVDIDDDSIVAQETLLPDSKPFRHVIMGNPGAGKTTFVQQFKKSVSATTDIPVIEVVCRHYAKAAWEKSVTRHIADLVTAEHAIQTDVDGVEAMLLLGRICMVFDGLDEVTDIAKRVQLISRIESVTRQYPMCSVLVTTRIVGYTRARLPRDLFTHLRLDEFTYDQFVEYCQKWFISRKRIDLYQSFENESVSVNDLRFNPLMLSLLCALYREHGLIPADRRGVYHQCAELLFRRWDNHRQIEHNEAMPKSSDRLMQEIAGWVSNSPALQDGVEEQQLVKIIAHSLADRDGYDFADAERDAASFIDFCAGRAWLLGSFGSNARGQRIFRFTHRTFLEYFTAENLARTASNDSDIVEKIGQAFRRDETSVLPELLLQSYDHHRDNGASRVFKELVRSDVSNLLLLRSMEGVSLPRNHRKIAFKRFVDYWTDHGIIEAEFNLLLGLNPQARSQFVEEHLIVSSSSPTTAASQMVLIDAWSGYVLSGAGGHLLEIWSPIMVSLAQELWQRNFSFTEAATANWLPSIQLSSGRVWYGWDAVISPSVYGGVPGVLWWTIEERLGHGRSLAENPARDTAIRDAYAIIGSQTKIPKPLLLDFRYWLNLNGTEDLRWAPNSSFGSEPLDLIMKEVVVFVMCALHEANEDTAYLLHLLSPFFDGSIITAFAMRDSYVKDGPRVDPSNEQSALEFRKSIPRWLERWFAGRLSVVQHDSAGSSASPNRSLVI